MYAASYIFCVSPTEQRPVALGARENTEELPAKQVNPSPPAADNSNTEEAKPAAATEQPLESRSAERSHRLLVFVATSALLMSMGAVTVIGLVIYHYRTVLTQPTRIEEDEDDNTTKRAGLSTQDDEDDEGEGAPPPSLEGVIKTTTTTMRGHIEVIDVGSSSASLPDVLLAQRIVADAKQQTLVLMLTGRRCDPCDGVDDALEDPLMQRALVGVRLVRVDLDVFRDELRRMDLPTDSYPAFFLLGDDLRPFDAIHGGEWGDGVGKNMAPVLGPFVRGELRVRRHPGWAPTTSSIPI